MPRHKGVTWEPWSWCDRCGFAFPMGSLIEQKGAKVCTVKCMDKLDIEYRPLQIQQVLNDGAEEGMPLTPRITESPEEIIF